MLELVIKEDELGYKSRIQLDEIMKKLFYIHNKRPIIDFLNSLFGDNISGKKKDNQSKKFECYKSQVRSLDKGNQR